MSFRTLLDELDALVPKGHRYRVVESKADHLLCSIQNFMQLLSENYDPEKADELRKRFVLAVKSSDPAKFKRGLPKDEK